ncbi:rod shape-determining protein [Pontibacter akesuensis]|uniref:Cell shape-determining protein MreB n=1 Tax=Pontibacter akesuensis TaxID=388950 RepID=A0A1I7FJC4_9BACT|nr:rod shape-determining protein [Pontibacter akesuensis]GHA61915.1 rod shape-determining protein [Pontibacter akesuensis]SFU36280.1 rod shape-determining protein MreB [Pontibacter akesuensis]
MGLLNYFSQGIAIDLGTANFLVIHEDKIVVDEPSIVAFDRRTGKMIAVGRKAMQMQGKAHDDIRIVRPLKDGVIADFHAAEQMIKGMLQMVSNGKSRFTPSYKMVICVPSGTTEVEKRAIRDSAVIAGAREVHLVHEPIAAAVGIGLDVEEPTGHMIIDIGGGTTEIAVIALSGIVCDQSVRVAGDTFDAEIVHFMRRKHNILIGQPTAERIKVEVGSALPELQDPPVDITIRGRDLMTGLPKQVSVSYVDVAHCLDRSLSKIEDAVLKTLEITPPELSGDIHQSGIFLTGGGALLRGLDKRISSKTKLPTHVVDDPLLAVVRGTGIALKNIGRFQFLMR